jgi:hypothetical protein
MCSKLVGISMILTGYFIRPKTAMNQEVTYPYHSVKDCEFARIIAGGCVKQDQRWTIPPLTLESRNSSQKFSPS